MARVVIVGGGVIGCAAAERLAREGHRVTLLERDLLGAHASGAAAGLLAPQSEAGADLDLAARSYGMFPELVARIEPASGLEVEYREQETVTPALTAAEETFLRGRAGGRWLDRAELLHEEPALNSRVRGAAIFGEAQVTPQRLVRALARAAERAGAELREGSPVARIATRAGEVSGVDVPEGRLAADWVVLAAGPWSTELAAGAGIPIDVRPSRGQLVMLQPRAQVLRRMLTWRSSYLVPKPDGTIVAGSTEEEVGFDARATAEGVAGLLEFARRAVPALGEATVERVWAALRPATGDGRPLVGPAPGLPNLVLATGHNRKGILLAPVTAELVAEAVRA